ncbi:UNVERIFIED_CONTAM: Transmembrane 9 superfamily member 1 [Sesamum indicum]
MRSALPFLCVFIFFFAFLFSSTLAKVDASYRVFPFSHVLLPLNYPKLDNKFRKLRENKIETIKPQLVFFLMLVIKFYSFGESKGVLDTYQADETVTLWVNKVGPYNNPQETYNYYSLPFCHPPGNAAHKWGGLGEVLGGNELIDSQIEIKFKRDVEKTKICEIELDAAKAKQFNDAIDNSYWFEFFMGFVGEVLPDRNRDNKHVLWTHKNLVINYNGNQIIHVNLTQENPKPLEEGRVLDMTYSVKWVPTNITFARRFDVYLDYPFFEHQIHWFSVFNSFMMVIFLTGLVSMILMRTLRNDYAKYAREDDDLETLERDVSEESGWKLVHGDVFRPPQNLALLSAVVGTGAQLATLVLLVIILAIVGMLYIGRGAIVTTFIVCYAFTSFIAGYVSGGMYSRNGGKKWIKSMILTASLFPFLCFGIGFILNTVAIFYGSLAAIPFGTMVVVFVIWAFISFPLALLGTVIGRNWSGAPNNPCRVKTIPRPIPEKKWYLTPSVISLMGGLLPFGSIFIEMYFVFTSFWNYKVYYVYGFMLLVFVILIIVTICVTIVGTYFLLNAENYHWQWTSFFSAASTALYVYFYSIYYYHVKTKMSGFFQTSFYFGYTLMFCLGLGILCGAVGYLGSNLFVRRIYRNIKCD